MTLEKRKTETMRHFHAAVAIFLYAVTALFVVTCITVKMGVCRDSLMLPAFVLLMIVFLAYVVTNLFMNYVIAPRLPAMAKEKRIRPENITVRPDVKQQFLAYAVGIITILMFIQGANVNTRIALRVISALFAIGTIPVLTFGLLYKAWFEPLLAYCVTIAIPFRVSMLLTAGMPDWFMISWIPIGCCFFRLSNAERSKKEKGDIYG